MKFFFLNWKKKIAYLIWFELNWIRACFELSLVSAEEQDRDWVWMIQHQSMTLQANTHGAHLICLHSFYLCFPTFIFSLCLGSPYLQMRGRDERKRWECDGTEEVHSFLSSVKAKLANYDVCIAGSANGERCSVASFTFLQLRAL